MRKQHGFTLIELIVVLGIIGILSGAIIFIINPVLQIQKGRDTTRKADLNNIRTALEIYRQSAGEYPERSKIENCGNQLATEGGLVVMQEIPCDPLTDQPYVYSTTDNGDGPRVVYTISACLENENDLDIEPPDSQIPDCQTTYTQQNP